MEGAGSEEIDVVSELARSFFAVVPPQYRTFCAQNARVAQEVLHRFGFHWDLLPCQLWHAGPNGNFIVGFTGGAPPHMWDGHVVCANDDWIFDPSVHHLMRANIAAPDVILRPRFKVRSHVIARHDLRPGERLWWYRPPPEMDPRPPQEPPELIDRFAAALFEVVRQRL